MNHRPVTGNETTNRKMMFDQRISELLEQPYDCLLLVHPRTPILEQVSGELQSLGIVNLNISRELSTVLLSISRKTRGNFSQRWLMDTLAELKPGPVLCTVPDLLFDPSFEIDPLALFRKAARIIPIIVLWLGEYSEKTLSYATPTHHHFHEWKLSESLLQQPMVKIHRLSALSGG